MWRLISVCARDYPVNYNGDGHEDKDDEEWAHAVPLFEGVVISIFHLIEVTKNGCLEWPR